MVENNSDSPESKNFTQSADTKLLQIAEEFGFSLTEQMKSNWDAATSRDSSEEQKAKLCETYNNQLLDLERPKSTVDSMRQQASILLAMAAMAYRCGFIEEARDYLDDSIDHLQNDSSVDTLFAIYDQYFALS